MQNVVYIVMACGFADDVIMLSTVYGHLKEKL